MDYVFMPGHHHFWAKGMARTLSCRLPLLTWWNLVAHVTDDLLGVDQKISDWLIKMIFLVKFRAAIRSWALAQMMPFGTCGFFRQKENGCHCQSFPILKYHVDAKELSWKLDFTISNIKNVEYVPLKQIIYMLFLINQTHFLGSK